MITTYAHNPTQNNLSPNERRSSLPTSFPSQHSAAPTGIKSRGENSTLRMSETTSSVILDID